MGGCKTCGNKSPKVKQKNVTVKKTDKGIKKEKTIGNIKYTW